MEAARTQAGHVLVVDDEFFFREAISEVLDRAGIPHLEADSGGEALALAGDERLAAVVLDLRLPDMTGLEVFERLCEIRPDLPVIILSAHTEQEYVLQALRLGACDYLAKPIHEEELALAVRRALDRHGLSSSWSRLRERLRSLEGALDQVWEGNGKFSPADAATRAAADVLEATKSSLMLLEPDGERLRVASAFGRELDPKEMDPVPVGEGVAGLALQSAAPLVVDDVGGDPRFGGRDVGGRYDTGSFAVAPLRAGDKPLGVLCVTDRPEGTPFDQEDLALLRILARQIGRKLATDEAEPESTVDVAELVDEEPPPPLPAVEQGDADLARAICDAVTAEVEPGRILAGVLRPVADALSAAPVSLYLASDGALARETEWDGGARTDRESLPLGRGLTGIVLETGRMVASADPAADHRFDPEVDTPEDGSAGPLLCVPIRFRDRTLGVLRAFPEGGDVPSARTGEVLSAALSAAVRNVLLYRSLIDSIEEVARARREAGAQ